jgi:hypothetical protein
METADMRLSQPYFASAALGMAMASVAGHAQSSDAKATDLMKQAR